MRMIFSHSGLPDPPDDAPRPSLLDELVLVLLLPPAVPSLLCFAFFALRSDGKSRIDDDVLLSAKGGDERRRQGRHAVRQTADRVAREQLLGICSCLKGI
jgi:hypothetical protein